MKSNYSFEKEENYLSLTISGTYDKMDFLSYPQLIKDECKKEGIHKVLINALNVTSTNPETMDRFFFGEKLADVLGGKIKLAGVWPEKDINKFAENVAINRGGYVSVFGDVETARKWLLSNACIRKNAHTTMRVRIGAVPWNFGLGSSAASVRTVFQSGIGY